MGYVADWACNFLKPRVVHLLKQIVHLMHARSGVGSWLQQTPQ